MKINVGLEHVSIFAPGEPPRLPAKPGDTPLGPRRAPLLLPPVLLPRTLLCTVVSMEPGKGGMAGQVNGGVEAGAMSLVAAGRGRDA